jgi:hypothetical protein
LSSTEVNVERHKEGINKMKRKLLALVLLAGGSVFGGITIGIHIGKPPAPRAEMARPASPGSGYTFVAGYWYPVEGKYQWHDGYWSRPPYSGALWIAPRHDGEQYFPGYWQGPGGARVDHDHDSDSGHDRDYGGDHH